MSPELNIGDWGLNRVSVALLMLACTVCSTGASFMIKPMQNSFL